MNSLNADAATGGHVSSMIDFCGCKQVADREGKTMKEGVWRLTEMPRMLVLTVLILLTFVSMAGATTLYLKNSQHSFGSKYWQLDSTAGGSANTTTTLFNSNTHAGSGTKYLFYPGADHLNSDSQSSIPQYGWASTASIGDTIPAGTWTFKYRISSQNYGAGGTATMQVRVFKATGGTTGALLFTTSGTKNFAATGTSVLETLTSNQPAFTLAVNEYLVVEYWMNYDNGGDWAFTLEANSSNDSVAYPTPVVDSTPPVPGTVSVSPQSASFVTAAYTITTSFTDAQTAVSSCDYTTNGTTWFAGAVSGSGPYICSASVTGATGNQNINMRATSLGGSGTASAISRTVDSIAPTTSAAPAAGTYSSDQSVLLSASDGAGSGVQGIVYCVDTANSCSPVTTYSAAVAVNGAAGISVTKYLRYRATDNLNQQEVVRSAQYVLDQTCSDVGASVSLDAISAPITGVIGVTATTNRGVAEVSVDGSNWVVSGSLNYTPPAQSTGSQVFYARTTNNCSVKVYDSANPTSKSYDTRTPGLVAGIASGGQTALDAVRVSMAYQGDVNGTAKFKVDYKLSTAGSWISGTATADTGASPYVQDFSALNSSATYNFRVSYLDAVDGVSGQSAIQTFSVTMQPWADSPLLHNDLRFSDTRHASGWGQPGKYAGAITCETCHTKGSANVKRVRTSINFPDGSNLPNGSPSATVSLQTVVDGSSDFGDDNTAPRSSSNKICEVCHTYDSSALNGVKRHAANQQTVSGHYDNADCIKCHQHGRGFRADCTTCHGNPPVAAGELTKDLDPTNSTGSTTWGKHLLHAGTKSYACTTCHGGWLASGQMPNNGDINIGFNAFGDTSATYNGRGAGSYTAAAGTTTTTNNNLTCSGIYCHGTSTPKWLDSEPAMACGSCHGDTSGMPSTVATDGDLSGATSGIKVGKHAVHVVTRGFACTLCHPKGNHTANDINGTVEVSLDTAQAGAGATASRALSSDPLTCSNMACHSDQVWDTATPALACNSCHGYPPTSSKDAVNNRHASGATPVNHDQKNTSGSTTTLKNNHADCQTCHGKSQAGVIDNSAAGGDAYLASYHMDGKIEMNGISTPNNNQSAEYVATGAGAYGCAKACHANNTAHQLSDSGLSVQLHEFGGGDCNGCHETGANGAPKVTSAGSHSENATGYTCVQCHGAHNAGTVEVPNNPTVGINYSANGESGIALGGTATTGSTEAEICWNCHQLGSTDWRKGGDFNGYTISARNWTTASFQPPGNILPNRPVASIHSVNAGAENSSVGNNVNGSGVISISSMETAGNIRCSYCHDVHDLNLATSDNKSGKPYLRGTWLSNPYPLERPPQSSDNYNGNVWSGQPQDNPVPRLFASKSTQTGGFFIDQNSGWPMNGKTLAGTAGLCTMCHGTNINSMDYYSASKLWVGTNGHSNSTIGGTGTKKSNLFDARRVNTGASQLNIGMQNQMVSFSSGSQWGDNSQPTWKPKDYMPSSNSIENVKPAENGYAPPDNSGWYGGTEGSHSRGGQYSTWYSSGGIGTNGGSSGRAHDFSCSKCHSPHASGLPALLITNCLDYKTVKNSGNGWSTTMRSRKQGTYTMGPKATNSIAIELMGNCHRNESQASGWNRLAPDQ